MEGIGSWSVHIITGRIQEAQYIWILQIRIRTRNTGGNAVSTAEKCLPQIPFSYSGVISATLVSGLIGVGIWFFPIGELRNTREGWEDIYLGKKKGGREGRIMGGGEGSTFCFSGGWGDRR